MDPLSQGVIAAVVAQQAARRRCLWLATVIGFLTGLTPDLDVLIFSTTDPLLSLEYHRQFTHSLFFIPFGSLVCAALLHYCWLRHRGLAFWQTYVFCALGYATHGVLDACTTYGTQLLWPFSDQRFAWHTISIIDPLFTLPLLILMLLAAFKRSRRTACMALAWAVIYSSLGVLQRERAEAAGWALAQSRGHAPQTLEAKPSFANILLWKIIYTTDTQYVVDAVRMGVNTRIYEGESIAKLSLQTAFPWLDPQSQQARDIERFRWFSNGYIAASPHHDNRIIDIRFSLLPNEIRGLWWIELDPAAAPDAHITYQHADGARKDAFKRLWAMLSHG
ncbi:MAG: metal-dependent hydrolase [Cellvibrionaceae bacterium]|nr:metal-dependent hydrolase [Cellvibrionaceae bacterium]